MGLSLCGRHATEVVWTSSGCNAVEQKAAEPLRECENHTTGFPAVMPGLPRAATACLPPQRLDVRDKRGHDGGDGGDPRVHHSPLCSSEPWRRALLSSCRKTMTETA